MGEYGIATEVRSETGKGVARRLRAAGRIPAVVYGRGKPSLPLSADPRDLERILSQSEAGLNTLIDLRVAGAGADRVVIVRELQRDPVRGSLVHADFVEIDLESAIEVAVPVHLIGTPHGVSMEGGIMEHTLREIEVECLPRAIPDSIDVDVRGLSIGDSIHVSDVTLPEGVTLRTEESLSVVSVVAARVAEEAEEAAAAEEAAEGVAAPPAEGEAAEAPPAAEGSEEGSS